MPDRAAGSKFGPYELISLIGEGGMGEVWKARDTRLNRVVALKFSQERFSEGFAREARAIATLNHPNIAQIYDVGENFIVMEFVDGGSTRAVDDTSTLLDIAVQIAEGLTAAHSAGLIHRDLKPDNVLITKSGRVKILDFGLAKQAAAAGASDVTLTSPTVPGVIAGTAAYMSPEQARGQVLDFRSDQFSFGLVLYELATGKRAFQRDSLAETLTAIMRERVGALPPELPLAFRRTIERCLSKDREERYDSTRDLYRELRQIRDDFGAIAEVPAGRPRSLTLPRPLLYGAAALLMIAAAAAGVYWRQARNAEPAWSGLRLGGPAVAMSPHISPDGQMLALIALVGQQTQLAIMKPDGASWTVLTNDTSNGSVCNLSWARDGAKLFFDRFWEHPSGVYSIPVLGGDATLLVEDAWAPQALPDGSLVVLKRTPGGHDQAYRFWPESGRSEGLSAYLQLSDLGAPIRAFSDGKEIVYIGAPEEGLLDGAGAPYILDLTAGKSRRLEPKASVERIVFQLGIPLSQTADGRGVLMLAHSGDSFDLIRVERDGKPGHTKVLPLANTDPPWAVDVGPDGSVYLDKVSSSPSIARYSPNGKLLAESPSTPPSGSMVVTLPDGRLLFAGPVAGKTRLLTGALGGDFRLFAQTQLEGETRFTVNAKEVALVLGLPGRQRVAFVSPNNGVLRAEVNIPGGNANVVAISPDSGTIYYIARGEIYLLPAAGGAASRIGAGEDIAMDPAGQFLLVKTSKGLVRLRLPDGATSPIAMPKELRLAATRLSPVCVDRNGRILLNVVSPAGWYYRPAIFDRELTLLPTSRPGEDLTPGWTPGGEVVTVHDELQSALWRFRR